MRKYRRILAAGQGILVFVVSEITRPGKGSWTFGRERRRSKQKCRAHKKSPIFLYEALDFQLLCPLWGRAYRGPGWPARSRSQESYSPPERTNPFWVPPVDAEVPAILDR